MRRVFLSAGIAAVLGAAIIGCGGGSDDPVLANVGSRTITAANLVESYTGMDPANRPDLSSLEGKQQFLNDLVNRELMELAASEKYPELTEPQTWRLKRFRESQITQVTRHKTIRDPIEITDAMKDGLYTNLGRERHLLGMLLIDEGRATWAREQLDEGADFSTLAKDHSVHWTLNDPPGDLGWMKAGEFLWEVEQELWDAPVETTLGPYRMAMGWYIFRVLDERAAEPDGTREEMDKFLESKLLEPMYMYRQRMVLDSLRTAAGPSYPAEGVTLIMGKYYWEPSPDEAENPYARLDANRETPTLTPEEETVPVIVFENRPDWTAAEFVERLAWYPTGLWPTGSSEAELEELLDIMVRDYLWLCAAEDRGYDQDEELLSLIERRKREMRVTYFYYNDIMSGLEVGPADIDAWFNANRERYKAPPSVKLSYFVSKDRPLVDDLAAEWRDGASFMALRDKFELRDPEMEAVGESPWVYQGQDPVFDDLINPLVEGEISEVSTRADITAVYRVVAMRDTLMLAYDEIKERVDQDAKTSLGDTYFQNFLEKQKENFPVKIHEEALEKVEIPELEPAAEETAEQSKTIEE